MRILSARTLAILFLILLLLGFVGVLVYRYFFNGDSSSNNIIREFLLYPDNRSQYSNTGYQRCGDAPFILPSQGLIGLLYADPARPYSATRRHTGIDIFGDGEANTIPIVVVYDGYLTRLPDWKSTLIIRHDDPLQAGRSIWSYYTHMASRDGTTSFISEAFPPATYNQFVSQGTLLGYQGEFAGDAPPIALHLHFSLVLSDTDGAFLNEAVLDNTLDPSPYFGMKLNIADDMGTRPIGCVDNN